ncbi:MAG: glycosyltransferase family 4 protein [Desulfatibacillaceae bacterium]
MRILFYAPMKPLGHANPSGDLIIATGLVEYLGRAGHQVVPASRIRARWIYYKPWLWPGLARDGLRAARRARAGDAGVWLTYHAYYKAPDVLGPWAARAAGLPYVVFQGIYSTKRRRDRRTAVGFHLNRLSLLAARRVFTNRREDEHNLLRLLPRDKVTYVPPGIYPDQFRRSPRDRRRLRDEWGVGATPVVLAAAMFRPGVKADGLAAAIRACGTLLAGGRDLVLVVAGDGEQRERLEFLAREHAPGRVRFPGKVPRDQLYRYYSAADVFAFPGIRESLGMVYLEAQSCGLPVVAYDNGGIPEVVGRGETGLLTPLHDEQAFAGAVETILDDPDLRIRMGRAAEQRVRVRHDLDRNYAEVETELRRIAEGGA